MVSSYYRSTIARVDLDALTHNFNFFKKRIPVGNELIAVVKADAYGHGAVPVAKHLRSIGANTFAVAFLDEAIQLRQAGITDSSILVLGNTPFHGIEEAFKHNITLTIFNLEIAGQINNIGNKVGKKLKVHIKVDTGMGRLGIFPKDLYAFWKQISEFEWVEIEGVYTHFASADEKDKTFTYKQYDVFNHVMNKIKEEFQIPRIHLANSAAMIDMPNLEQNTSRLGISLYGLLPSKEVNITPSELKPVMSLMTEVSFIKQIEIGQTVSYGATFKAARPTLVATLPIGYADGLSRKLSNKGYVIVNGNKAPIIGRICMDQTMIDVTDIPNVNVGSQVIIFGEQQGATLTIDDHAKIIGTINYELATQVGKRIPRIYVKNQNIVELVNPLIES